MKKRDEKGRFVMQPDGGTYIDSEGYPTICAGPLRGMRVHRLVGLAKFGRKALDKRFHIHHLNGNKLDPSPDNLQLIKCEDHNALSAKQLWFLKTHVWPKEKKEWEQYFKEANGGGADVEFP